MSTHTAVEGSESGGEDRCRGGTVVQRDTCNPRNHRSGTWRWDGGGCNLLSCSRVAVVGGGVGVAVRVGLVPSVWGFRANRLSQEHVSEMYEFTTKTCCYLSISNKLLHENG